MNRREDCAIPIVETYRGVGLHDCQSEARLAVVRGEIDKVFALDDLDQLVEVCSNVRWSPESRLLAAAKLKATHQLAAEDRKSRPRFDISYVDACTAGLNSRYWRSPWHFGSLLDPGRAPGEAGPVPRPVPLEDDRT
ncbi:MULTISPECIES: hypothetical protein [unclassified Mesorhizobium]|uniref:hypothetical protein n=1 Tax=unclassified Mesorhizobium TaxID=325217 RepID=UPI000FDCBCA8|nr:MULTISPECIES: hypothetical protein [unclassified Mesorhizobium]TGQ09001.1 hypothetical protein EN862_022480 [Mesorhizobium sp. M2E.F.Ca.ET.219.01.1.1]TGT69536.1 hypothetical protein EN809_024760 [Mesorhizobium sp. M2E.F.Ca.ET.166.01.1.1]TGW01868.1 hypothetical protein EN797_016255 [Mesorhizobium sp. M2E.F.Ca.ET.154.01.1.1]